MIHPVFSEARPAVTLGSGRAALGGRLAVFFILSLLLLLCGPAFSGESGGSGSDGGDEMLLRKKPTLTRKERDDINDGDGLADSSSLPMRRLIYQKPKSFRDYLDWKNPVLAAIEKAGWHVGLFFDERYRYRASSNPDEEDHDLDLYFDLDFTDPTDHYRMDSSFGIWWDADGGPDWGDAAAFASVRNTNDPAVFVDVYKLSVEYYSAGPLLQARAGRQIADFGLPAPFDGGSFLYRPKTPFLDLFVFGGRTVHFFEVGQTIMGDWGAGEDWLASAGAVIRPREDLKFEIDYRFAVEDVVLDFSGQEITQTKNPYDHSFGLTGWYRRGERLSLKGYVRTLDDALSNVGAAGRFEWTKRRAGVEVGLDAQTTTLSEITEESDPYFAILGESLPYVQIHLDGWKEFARRSGTYNLHVGYETRYLVGNDEKPFNRNYGRVYLLGTAADIFAKGLFCTAVFERWGDDVSLKEDGLWTVGGSAGFEDKTLRAEAGSFYQAFEYDYYYDVNERTKVRTVFVDLRAKPLDWFWVRARYEYERFDRDLQTVTFGLSQVY